MKLFLLLVQLSGLLATHVWAAAPFAHESQHRRFLKSNFPRHYQADVEFERAGLKNSDVTFRSPKTFCDSAEISSHPRTEGRYFDLYQNTGNPSILVMRFRSKELHDLMWERISQFGGSADDKEKLEGHPNSYRYVSSQGLMLTGAEIRGFFNLMATQKLAITSLELALLRGLLAKKVMRQTGKTYSVDERLGFAVTHDHAGKGTIEHELNHAAVHAYPELRAKLIALYASLSFAEKKLVQDVLNTITYTKTTDEDLEKNPDYDEFGAYFRDAESMFSHYAASYDFTPEKKSMIRSMQRRLLEIETGFPVLHGCGNKVQGTLNTSDWIARPPSVGK